MKRHEALAPFSREHHSALILAQLCKNNAPIYRGLPADDAGKAAYAIALFNDQLKAHFKSEETVFYHVLTNHPSLKMLIDEIIDEHRFLESLFRNVQEAGDISAKLHALGITLEKHIRKEERVLFPAIQELCSEEELCDIAKILDKTGHEKGHQEQK